MGAWERVSVAGATGSGATAQRAAELGKLGLDENALLPFAQQKKVQDRLRQRWLESPDGRLEPP